MRLRFPAEISTHSRAKAAGIISRTSTSRILFQLTAARRRLARGLFGRRLLGCISTHSRAKAAGQSGCRCRYPSCLFQLTAARRRLGIHRPKQQSRMPISTHSRAKAAGTLATATMQESMISTRSRAKAAGLRFYSHVEYRLFQLTAARKRLVEDCYNQDWKRDISTHSRAKAAGRNRIVLLALTKISTHSRAKAAGLIIHLTSSACGFQLTAARRRLVKLLRV